MKKILILITTVIFTNLNYSQKFDMYSTSIQEIECYYQDGQFLSYNKNNPHSSNDNTSYVGKKATSTATKNAFRSIYSWAHNIPTNSIITSGELKIKFSITSEKLSPNDYVKLLIKEFPKSHYNESESNQWSKISSTTTLHTTDPILKNYENGTLTIALDDNFRAYFQNNLNNSTFHLAFRTHDDETFGTNNNINYLNLKIGSTVDVYHAVKLVLYYEPAAPVEFNLTAKNKMDNNEGGNIGVGKNTSAYLKSSPHSFNAIKDDMISLTAYENQSYNGYNWIWNDTEATYYKSKWEKKLSNSPFELSNNQSTTYKIQPGDDGANFIANLRKQCNVTFKNEHSGGETGGQIIVNGSTYNSPTSTFNVIEQNTISATAVYHEINNIRFVFEKWSTDNSTQSTKTFTLSSHENIKAIFEGTPKFNQANRNLSFNSFNPRVPQFVKLYWNEHSSTNVTQYKIWRKGKDVNGNIIPTELLATVNRGTTTYTDTDYYLTGTYSDALLQYDVQAYYQPDNTLSDHDFITVYGENSGVNKEAVNDSTNTVEAQYEYGLSNYPNPYNPTTTISYQVKEMGNVNIIVYDVLGRKITELVNEVKQPGSYKETFDGSNITSGIYFYSMQANDFMQTNKMLLTK